MSSSDRGPAPGFALAASRSAFTDHNGPWFEKHVGAHTIRAFRVLEKHTNSYGIAHGGLLMSFADSVLARAALGGAGRSAVTMRMVCDFVGPARLGDWVEGAGEVSRVTRHLSFVRARIWTGTRTVMTASGIFSAIRSRPERNVAAAQEHQGA